MFIEDTINPPPNLGMENARCKNHANHNEYGIGSFNLGMGNDIGILAWGMLTANGMPTFGDRGEHGDRGECWHGECW